MTTLSFTFEDFNPLDALKYSSDSLVENSDRLIDIEKDKIIRRNLLGLKNIIGGELFEELSYQDRIFMIETANSIDFGHAIDLEKISQEIKNHDVF